MINFDKYLNPDQDKSVFLHSSGHAQLGQGMQIGAASSQTFQQRLELTGKARTVADYRQSMVGARRGTMKARPLSSERSGRTEKPDTASQARGGFKAPPSRGYDPYA